VSEQQTLFGEASAPPPRALWSISHLGQRKQTWTTPQDLFAQLHREYRFTLDGAASADNALLPRYSSWREPLPWTGERVFCNPPWSNIAPFVREAATADLAVLLVPSRVNTRWFNTALALGAEPRFFQGKLRFSGARWNCPADCLLLIFEAAQTCGVYAASGTGEPGKPPDGKDRSTCRTEGHAR